METRAGKYGRLGVAVLRYIVGTLPATVRRGYLVRFLREYMEYSDMPRKRGEPRNAGCVRELDGIDELDVLNPEHFARWFKEGQHLDYQKNTSGNERRGFFGALKS